ncbi:MULTISPECIES: LuxR family transcriptional regulator [Burkholderiaceae]|uniref:helix-turn-helix transcriptional regulator n=1 Tax=Burkholderiaceae TaxID=119060 RepID=UPI00095B618D|nr:MULTISPECIES: LuxR family transcriptional regulator [Burkholderiaceae]MCF2133754.1 LuxR family transcriptional regulator [Mycetohabitans sp. B3]MCG1018441.1 LuxR family transcriptional regulator [Mycetohabitans sp. B4]MCG1039307.1 LuxR family transcriptional regulator [Mycetohabitans sp. B7]SIT66213.1 transcriptional regulator, LuxR family [Burkholderia sp. b13]SIT68348.1 regulatory protein, luxR family [Burkholderia sp. b14]
MEQECETLPYWLTRPASGEQPNPSDGAVAATAHVALPPGGFLTLFTEQDIGAPKADPRQPLTTSPLLRYTSVQDRVEFMRGKLAQLGFDSFSYIVPRKSSDHKSMFVLTDYESRSWLSRYFRERYFDFDPRIHCASSTGLPSPWSAAQLRVNLPRAPSRSQRIRQLIELLEEDKRRSGLVIRFPLPRVDTTACLCFNSSMDDIRWLSDTLVAQTLMFAHAIHEFIWTHAQGAIGLAPAPQREGIALSELQQSILQAVVQGRRDKEIAYFLGLSPHNVDYHMRRLRTLFNVRNRVQLINVARAYL